MNSHTIPRAQASTGWWQFLLALTLLVAPAVVLAEQPELYGPHYLRLNESAITSDGERRLASTMEETALSEHDYRETLDSSERENGPYADALAQPLAGLGNYYRERGEYDKAMESYRRALHIVRINDGLYSERQIPIVRDLLDTYGAAGDMETLDQRYEYFFRLYGNGQPPYTELRMRANLEYLRWQREAVMRLDEGRVRRMAKLCQLNSTLLESISQSSTFRLDWYRQLVLSQVHNFYLLQSEFLPQQNGNYYNPYSSTMSMQQGQGVDLHQQRLELIARGSPRQGAKLLEDLVNRTRLLGSSEDVAQSHLELGDWYQWNGSRARAGVQYNEVIALLKTSGNSELLKQWLEEPVELPAHWPPTRYNQGRQDVALRADYVVSASGEAREINVTPATPEGEAYSNRLRRKLSDTRFRPRYILGEAEAATGISRNYQLFFD